MTMTNISLNTLLFDTERRTGADQAVLLPTGSVPVFILFGDSTSAGSDSDKSDVTLEDRVFDEPYVGRTVGYIWNHWMTTEDNGATFEADLRNGQVTDGNGDAFEEAVPLGGGVSGFGNTAYEALDKTDPAWGFLRGIYGLFRDEVTNEIVVPRLIRVCRTGSFAGEPVAGGQEEALSWFPSGVLESFNFHAPFAMLVDVVQAAVTDLTGTESYLCGAISTAALADTRPSVNTDPAEPTLDKAARLGENLQAIREELEVILAVDQFPMLANTARKVDHFGTGADNSNTYDLVMASLSSQKEWSRTYDMVGLIDTLSIPDSLRGNAGNTANTTANPHFSGHGSIVLGDLWATSYRNMLANPAVNVTAPRLTT